MYIDNPIYSCTLCMYMISQSYTCTVYMMYCVWISLIIHYNLFWYSQMKTYVLNVGTISHVPHVHVLYMQLLNIITPENECSTCTYQLAQNPTYSAAWAGCSNQPHALGYLFSPIHILHVHDNCTNRGKVCVHCGITKSNNPAHTVYYTVQTLPTCRCTCTAA